VDAAQSLEARPWRRAALVASAIAVLELAALVVVGIALLGGPVVRALDRHRPAVASQPEAAKARIVPAPQVARLSRAKTQVLVLNGNGRPGAAAAEALSLQTLGYRVGATGNAVRGDYAASMVMYRPGYRPEALRLGRDTGIKVVGPLDGLRVADLRGSQLALIVGT